MKPRHLVIAGVILMLAAAALVRLGTKQEIPPGTKPAATTATADGMDLATDTDPTNVFRKAFWRNPTGDDEILHAERREWSEEGGVQKWQWFIAVRPGPQLLEWLATNPFSMATSNSAGEIERPPEWFTATTEGFQITKNAEGRFILMLSSDQKLLYATDSGLGFTAPGVPE